MELDREPRRPGLGDHETKLCRTLTEDSDRHCARFSRDTLGSRSRDALSLSKLSCVPAAQRSAALRSRRFKASEAVALGVWHLYSKKTCKEVCASHLACDFRMVLGSSSLCLLSARLGGCASAHPTFGVE